VNCRIAQEFKADHIFVVRCNEKMDGDAKLLQRKAKKLTGSVERTTLPRRAHCRKSAPRGGAPVPT